MIPSLVHPSFNNVTKNAAKKESPAPIVSTACINFACPLWHRPSFVTNSCPPFPLVINTCAPPYPCTFLAKLIHSSSDISSQENSAISTIALTCFRYSSVRYLSSDEKSKLIIGPNARTLSI